MTFKQFKETLQPYQIEMGFGEIIEAGFIMHYLPKNHPDFNKRFTHRNKRKAFKEYKQTKP